MKIEIIEVNNGYIYRQYKSEYGDKVRELVATDNKVLFRILDRIFNFSEMIAQEAK